MAEFLKVIHMKGWDSHRTPRWQMVPFLGTRYIALRGGAGMTVTSSSLTTVIVTEIKQTDLPAGVWGHERTALLPTDRVFMLFGVWRGAASIEARDATGSVRLDVNVKFLRTVRITFTFISDNAGHSTTRVPASAAQWLKKVNYIFLNQANVQFIIRDARAKTVAKDLGPVITTTSTGVGEEADIYPQGDSGADFNIFMVWECEITDDTGNETGFQDGKNILLDDRGAKDIAESVAHELGHALGLPDQYTIKRKLMYGYDDVRGIDLSADDVNVVNNI